MLWLTHALWSSLLAFHLKVLIISVGFESGSVVKNLPANMGDTWAMGSILGSGRSPEVGNGNSLQYCCLGNPMEWGAWRAIVHEVTKSQTGLSMHALKVATCPILTVFLRVCVGYLGLFWAEQFPWSIVCSPWSAVHRGLAGKVLDYFPFSSVHFSRSVLSDSLRPHGLQHARPPCPSPTLGVYSNSCPLRQWWCHSTILSSVVPFFYLQSFPASSSFQKSHFFASSGHSIIVSASTSVPPMNTQDWSPLGWTGWISLQSRGLSRVFSITTVQMHQFFGTQLSLCSNSHIHTWLVEKP